MNTTQTWSIDKLHEFEHNSRIVLKDGYARLKKQVEMGEFKPLLVMPDGTVLGGNTRLKVYKDLGIKEAWVSTVEFKQEGEVWRGLVNGVPAKKTFKSQLDAMTAYSLADNDRAGAYDEGMLANLLPSLGLDLKDYAIDLGQPIALNDLSERYSDTREDDVPSVSEAEPISKPGEIYQLGRHRLLCGDATKLEDIKRLMNGKIADMVFTDPPYNIAYEGGMGAEKQNKRKMIMNDKMSNEEFYQFLLDAITNMMAVCPGIFYICMSSKEIPNLMKAFESAGGHWQSFIIWVKNNFTLSRSDYQNQYEPILYGWSKAIRNHFFIDDRTQGNVWEDLGNRARLVQGNTEISIGGVKLQIEGKIKGKILRGKRKLDIWRYDKPSKSEEHPTMNPVLLCAEAIKNSTIPDQLVLDTFGGSGTTLIAAEQTARTCYMSELDPRYCDVIRKRYARYLDQSEQWQTLTPKV